MNSATHATESVVRAEALGYSYPGGSHALNGVSFDVGRGEVFGLLGRNGAGKTTTVRLLTGLIAPTEGRGYLFGKDITECGPIDRARIGVVLQSESFDTVSVEENLRLYAYLWGVGREIAKARTEEFLELFELRTVREKAPWLLSGGERRRFQVARELMHDMELLFLDEATVGVDALTRARILDYLRDRVKAGLSILFTTHILSEADRICDRIGILHSGRLLSIATPNQLKAMYSGPREVRLEVEIAPAPDDLKSLHARLESDGVDFSVSEAKGLRFVFVSKHAEVLVTRIAQWAVERRLAISKIGIQEATLEDAFIQLLSAQHQPEREP